MPTVYLGLGSNVEARKHLGQALSELERRFGKLTRSSVYRSSAYGFQGDDFLNMVVAVDTELPPSEIHAQLEEIHDLAGRDRSARGYSPRTLDIDLLLYGDLVLNDPPVSVPRPDVLRFSWVLGPLAEIAPELIHPGGTQSYEELWQAFDQGRHPISREHVIL